MSNFPLQSNEKMVSVDFNIEAELARIQQDEVLSELETFFEVQKPFSMRVTTV